MNLSQIKKLASKQFVLRLVAFGVFANGALIIYTSLLSHLLLHHNVESEETRISITLLIGLSLVYLSTLINRRKHMAWLITLVVYSFLLIVNVLSYEDDLFSHNLSLLRLTWSLLLPAIVVFGLVYYRSEFKVKSDIRNFTLSLRFIVVILLITFFYGMVGMQLFDKADFHQELSWTQSAHYTIDQFGLTTNGELQAYTNRARVFLFTLSLVSITSIIYVVISLFQPLKARFRDQSLQRQQMEDLLVKYGGSSEDFFKIWPKDKGYIFDSDGDCGLAFQVDKGVALSVGDPAGNKKHARQLLDSFEELCHTNDWRPAFIHTEPSWNSFYRERKYSIQKIGEESVVDLQKLTTQTAKNKYFRNINNRFKKNGYSSELCLPPHSAELMAKLKNISDDWLKLPGRDERGFMMGYFDADYMQMCPILIARDQDGSIRCFINQVPSYDKQEANYDLLRYGQGAPGNINDYVLLEYASYLYQAGYTRLNLGLSPLVGLDETNQDDKTVIDHALKLLYSRGDRFYSFSGMHKFKQKYEPYWQDRFVAYKGGIRGVSRTASALNKAMSKSPKQRYKII